MTFFTWDNRGGQAHPGFAGTWLLLVSGGGPTPLVEISESRAS